MRQCGECALCCKIPAIEGLKPTNEWCPHCVAGKSCAVYGQRPKVCREFECRWLTHSEMPDEARPDRVHFYLAGEGEVLKVMVDPDYPDAWKGNEIVKGFLKSGHHLLVACGHQLNFLVGRGRTMPEKIIVDWVL